MFKNLLSLCLFLSTNIAVAEDTTAKKDAEIGFQKTEKIVEFLAEYKKQKGYYPPDLKEMDSTLIDVWLRERKFNYLSWKNGADYMLGFDGRGFLVFFSFRCVRGAEQPWQCSVK